MSVNLTVLVLLHTLGIVAWMHGTACDWVHSLRQAAILSHSSAAAGFKCSNVVQDTHHQTHYVRVVGMDADTHGANEKRPRIQAPSAPSSDEESERFMRCTSR